MNGRSVAAIAICVVCFFAGYLFYVGVTMIAGFFIGEANTCRDTVAVCAQEKPAP